MSYLYRIKYRKDGPLIFVSHLDLSQLLRRILLRAEIPVEWTQGFNPRIKASFAPALPLGLEGWQEITEIILKEPLEEVVLKDRINEVTPNGFTIVDVEQTSDKNLPLSKLLKKAIYFIYLAPKDIMDQRKMECFKEIIENNIGFILNQKEIKTKKVSKKGLQEIDLRPFIHDMTIFSKSSDRIIILLVQNIVAGGLVNPNLIMDQSFCNIMEFFSIEKIVREKFINELPV
ncbi:MAG: TIGR03936 family radical SAM-associated protein [Atribacterota bacterium]